LAHFHSHVNDFGDKLLSEKFTPPLFMQYLVTWLENHRNKSILLWLERYEKV